MNAGTNILNRTYIEVQIPEELSAYVMTQTSVCGKHLTVRTKGNSTHHLSKVMGFYLLLKAESPGSSLIQDYTKQITTLSHNFNISKRSFFNYIKQLEGLKLASKDGNNIKVASWDQLGKLLDINTKKRIEINFNYDQKQKIHWWFAALEIKSNQESQSYMIWKKMNKNSEIKNSIMSALISRGFDTTKANNLEYFSGRLFMLNIEDFRTGTEVHDILIRIRSDVNRSCKKIGKAWEMSPQLVCYWKAQMRAQRIIDVGKLTVTSEYTMETKECHKNKFCHVLWNDKLKERVWFLCDQISILMPWKWVEFLAISKA